MNIIERIIVRIKPEDTSFKESSSSSYLITRPDFWEELSIEGEL